MLDALESFRISLGLRPLFLWFALSAALLAIARRTTGPEAGQSRFVTAPVATSIALTALLGFVVLAIWYGSTGISSIMRSPRFPASHGSSTLLGRCTTPPTRRSAIHMSMDRSRSSHTDGSSPCSDPAFASPKVAASLPVWAASRSSMYCCAASPPGVVRSSSPASVHSSCCCSDTIRTGYGLRGYGRAARAQKDSDRALVEARRVAAGLQN